MLFRSKRMGHAYIPYFVKDRDLRLRISTYIKLKGWISLKMAIESLQKEMTIVKAIHAAVEQISSSAEPAGSTVTDDDMEDMFK